MAMRNKIKILIAEILALLTIAGITYAGISGGISIPILMSLTGVKETADSTSYGNTNEATTTYLTNIISGDNPLRYQITNYASTTVDNALVLDHLLTGSAYSNLTGRGIGLLFRVEDSGNTATTTGRIASVLTQSATTSPASDMRFSIKTGTGSLTEILRLTASSTIGIATATPSGTLGVQGSGFFSGGMFIGGSLTATSSVNLATSAGNVGIATTSPSVSLDVNGYLKVLQTATTTSCVPAIAGSIFFNQENNYFWGCDGTSWNRLY